jgi:asparagine synthase (glutamine-hydrolysing)
MCGITGLWQAKKRIFSRDAAVALVNKMNDSVAHRGPDSEGVWSDPEGRCVLAQRRLAIIDTSDAGRQPFVSGDGRWWITFNGEIYNFQELRSDLEALGVRLRGRTDTEVLLEAIVLWGTDALRRLDGMFAFAAYDTVSQTLLLARDPFGEKPLYYTMLPGGGIAFASELQALELLPDFDATVDVDAVAEVLSFQYIGAPRSIYSSVLKLPPAHWMRISPRGEHHIRRYFSYSPGVGGYTSRTRADLVDELEDILTQSIKRRLIADVPLGAFLSGGVDSSTVCALVRRKLGLPLQTFSTGFANAPESEHETARIFAEVLGTDHHEQVLDPEAADFLRGIGNILDEPNADSSCLPVYLLSGFARKTVTVALSGDGGDELFGGYGRYFATLDDQAEQTPATLSEWCPGDSYYGPRILVSNEERLSELLGFVPPAFSRHLNQLRADIDGAAPRQLLGRLRRTDANNYMPGAVLSKVDRMSMRHALEVRSPYLNVELARFAERLPDGVLVAGGRGKLLLRDLAYRYLPRELVDLPKQGFGLPMTDWGRTSLLNVATDLLEAEDCRVLPLFGREGIGRFLARQWTPGEFSTYQVWALTMLESWLRHHPAVVPDLTFRRPKPNASETAERPSPSEEPSEPSPKILTAARVSKRLWLVSMRGADQPGDPRQGANWQDLPAALRWRIDELGAEQACIDTRMLPAWGKSVSPAEQECLGDLTGSCLAFLDADARAKVDYSELCKFSRLGVARLIFAGRNAGETEEIRLQPKSLKKRLLHSARLLLHSRARIANRRLYVWPLCTTRFQALDSKLATVPELRQLPLVRDCDISHRYMVFEGIRQLPPISTSDAEISDHGGGRYSVRGQSLRFSATDPSRLFTYPFWVVERTPKTEQLLQFVPERRFIKEPRQLTLNTAHVGDCVWVVVRSTPNDPVDPLQSGYWRHMSPAVMARVFDCIDGPQPQTGIHELIQLPDWGIPICDEPERLAPLQGATLAFLDPDAAESIDYEEMLKFSSLGVERLIFAGPDGADGTHEIRIQNKSVRRRMRDCGHLFLRARALITNRRIFGLLTKRHRYEALQGALCQTTNLQGIVGDETCGRYMVFEGIRQLPPLPNKEGGIAGGSRGRYTVSPHRLTFTPTEPNRRFTHPYWIVERTPNTERLLQFVPEHHPAIAAEQMSTALDRVLGPRENDCEAQLQVGDRIVVFTHALPPGGAERQWIYLAQGLKDMGYDVIFVTYAELTEGNGHYLPLLKKSGIPHHLVSYLPWLTVGNLLTAGPAFYHIARNNFVPDAEVLFGLTECFSHLRPKAVITQLDHPNLFASFAALLAGIPRVVMSFRNYNPSNFDYIYADWYQPAYALLAQSRRVAFSGNSSAANRDYEDWIGLDPGRAAHIPNALDPDHFPLPSAEEVGSVRRELDLDLGNPVVLGVFRLSKEKNPFTFIEVCAHLAATYPKLQVLIAGIGPLQPELEIAAGKHGLTSKIRFLGRRSDVNVLMALSDLLLLTSEKEGMPNVVIEAQRMGLPVVATDAGGTKETLLPEISGIVCSIGDIASLCAACRRVIDNRDLANAMGEAGRRHVADAFSKQLMARRYLDLIAGSDPSITIFQKESEAPCVVALRA